MTLLSGRNATQGVLATLVGVAEAAERATGTGDWPRQAGIVLGLELERRWRGDAELPETPDTNSYARAAVQILKHLVPGSQLVGCEAEQVVLAIPAPTIGVGLPRAREQTLAAVVGGIAARYFGYGRVRLEPRLVEQETSWLVTVSLTWTPVRAAAAEEEYRRAEIERLDAWRAGPAAGIGALGVLDAATGEQGPISRSARLRALGETAVSVAHGLNNLLGTIVGEAAQLRNASNGVEHARGIQLIQQAAADGATIVRRLLRLNRGQPVSDEAEVEPVELDAIVQDAIRMARARWQDDDRLLGGPIQVRAELGGPPAVLGIATDLREIVLNLIGNAVDAMPDGGTLTLRTEAHPDRAVLICRDTGVGMPEDVQQRIFEPFFTTKEAEGTGMGLAIVYGVVARLGGELGVESQVGRGTAISISLPAAGPIPLGRPNPLAPFPKGKGELPTRISPLPFR